MNRLTRIALTMAATGLLAACSTPPMQASNDLLSYELLGAAITVTREADEPELQRNADPDRSEELLVSAR